MFMRVMHVNVTAAFVLTQHLLPLLRASKDAARAVHLERRRQTRPRLLGRILDFEVRGGRLHAGAGARARGHSTVRVNIIDPGKVRTAMRRQAYPSELAESLPTPESLTAPYLALLGPASRGVTGQRFEAQVARPT